MDLTGGAPEMNPDLRWSVERLSEKGSHIIVRCNLTIILANKKYHDLTDLRFEADQGGYGTVWPHL